MNSNIAACISIGNVYKALPIVIESISILRDSVDDIIVQGEGLQEESVEQITKRGIHYFDWKWDGVPAHYRNKSMSWTNCDWVLVLDHDEIPSAVLAKNLRRYVEDSNKSLKYQVVQLYSCLTLDGRELGIFPDKTIFHVNAKNLYVGNYHPVFRNGVFRKMIVSNSDEFYEHRKTTSGVYESGARDVFCAGGGNDFLNRSGLWTPLREWSFDRGILTWNQFKKALVDDDIDDWCRGWFEKAWKLTWHDYQYKSFKAYYYLVLHPNKLSEQEQEALRSDSEFIFVDGRLRMKCEVK